MFVVLCTVQIEHSWVSKVRGFLGTLQGGNHATLFASASMGHFREGLSKRSAFAALLFINLDPGEAFVGQRRGLFLAFLWSAVSALVGELDQLAQEVPVCLGVAWV
jgi:hypothetical protein